MRKRRFLYLHGFASSPASKKAAELSRRFARRGIHLEAPDLTDGDFRTMTISRQLEVVRRTLLGDPAVLIGSSLGGYVAALYAARHPEIERLVLLAPAFGVARRWEKWLGPEGLRRWRETGEYRFFHYATGREEALAYDFFEDARRWEDFPAVRQPVLVCHGTGDEVVPVEVAREFARRTPRARLRLLDSGHDLLDAVAPIWAAIEDFLGLRRSPAALRSREESPRTSQPAGPGADEVSK